MPQRMIESLRYFPRANASLTALFLLGALLCPSAHGADKDKKEVKEKPEKVEPWIEIRTAHFIVASDGGEKTARRVADQFEWLLRVFQATMPNCRVSTGIPVRILAPRDGKSFARMAPEFPYDSRHEQPPGLFFSGPEKTYIGIRTNASGHFPFAGIYQNYARMILKLSYRNLPPWLEEGYSAVYSNLTFTDKGMRLARPDPDDLSVLFESPLLPLDLVLSVDRNSLYYTSGSKDTVYFAESRVLVHMLISDPQFSASQSLARYVTALASGGDSLKAARDAFGDLNQLQTKLDAYVKQTNAPPVDLPVAAGSDSGAPRTLTAAESSARIADFLALRGRSGDAQDRLEDALKTDPSLAEAEQSLGFILLKKNDLEEAEKHFERATQLDAKDALNFYGQGLVAIAKGGNVGVPVGAVAAFEKAVTLNPDFAPAWYNLAAIYALRDDMTQKALADAQRAASLVPGDSGYQMQVAALLSRMGRTDEARKTAANIQGSSADRATVDKAGDLIARTGQPQPAAAATPAKAPADSGLLIERKTEPENKPAATPSPSATLKAEPPPPPVPPLFSDTQEYSMVGTISDVNCANSPQVQMTLKSLAIVMKLHAEDLAKVFIKSAGSGTAAKAPSCSNLRGRTARISYSFVTGKPWDAEIKTVEFRGQP